jgi:hypothetical protein
MKTNSPRFSIRLRIAVGVVLLFLAAGCSSKGSVTGKVFYKDKPLAGGMVHFSHPEAGILSSPIGADGSYQFTGVPMGEVKIGVTGPPPESNRGRDLPKNIDWEKVKATHPPGTSEEVLKKKMGIRSAPPSADATISLPEKYTDLLQSPLTYTVTSGSQVHDIKLD